MSDTASYKPAHTRNSDISILEFWRAILTDWRLVVVIIVVFTAVSIAIALLLNPLYRAEVTVVEASQGTSGGPTTAMLGQFGGLASLAGVDLGNLMGRSSNFRAVLKSRMIIEEFITRNDLLPVLFPDQWDSDAEVWLTQPDDSPTLWYGVKYFIENVRTIQEDPTEGVIRIIIEWTDPEQAAEWANGLVALTNEIIRKKDLAEAERNVAYLNEEIGRTNVVELQQVLYSLIETEMQTIMLANAKVEYAFPVIDPAVPPELRSFPRRTLTAVAGVILGGFAALVVVLVRLTIRKGQANEEAAD